MKPGWWNSENNNLKWEEVEALRDRYGKLYQILRALKRHPTKESINEIIELKNYWESQPALNDDGGLDQIVDLCLEVLPENKVK